MPSLRCGICAAVPNGDDIWVRPFNLHDGTDRARVRSDLRMLCTHCTQAANVIYQEQMTSEVRKGRSHHSLFVSLKAQVKKRRGLSGNLFYPSSGG